MSTKYNKYALRRDSLISPWGVGAIVPFPNDESLMVAGLDYWFDEDHSFEDFLIHDERLTKRLGGKQLVSPPDFREILQDREHAGMKIPAVRFPLWHYCPACGNVERIGTAGSVMHCPGDVRKSNGKETSCSKSRASRKPTPTMIPERFIAVCEDGHIEDFPIMEWVHKKSGRPRYESCKLTRSTGGNSSSLAGVRYTCTCGASANMKDAFNKDSLRRIGYTCSGRQPWLGNRGNCSCGKPLMVLQRGASNVWFAETVSSVYIPWIPKYKSAQTKEVINDGIRKFASSRVNGEIDFDGIKRFVETWSKVKDGVDQEQAISEIIATLKNQNIGEESTKSGEEYKKQEFDVLTRNAGKPRDELYVVNNNQDQYNNIGFLKSISLVHKLRETRAFLGFKRISPNNPLAKIQNDEQGWIPAIKNQGEGIMFEFDYKAVSKWSEKPQVQNRIRIIETNIKDSTGVDLRINPAYILLHTFAHCIITALANQSGYSNASIREKIYCSKLLSDSMIEMAGVLIYTASGDSEGSLGGLVRQGQPGRIEQIIRAAISEARWCAADPVCIQSNGQGQDGCNLAACHNCALLPETSCENQNKYLDRGLLIGTLDNQDIGFFNDYYI